MPRAEKEVFVELPMEDLVKANGYVGRWERSVHGTQDASQEDPYQRCSSVHTLMIGCLNMVTTSVMLADGTAGMDLKKLWNTQYTVTRIAQMEGATE